jgi:hypothetical protein
VGQVLPRLSSFPHLELKSSKEHAYFCHHFVGHYATVLRNEIDFSVDIGSVQSIHVLSSLEVWPSLKGGITHMILDISDVIQCMSSFLHFTGILGSIHSFN